MNKELLKEVPPGQENMIIGVMVFLLLTFGFVYFLYVRNLFLLMKAVGREQRRVAPAKVWLLLVNFIPVLAALLPAFLDEKKVAPYTVFFTAIQYIGMVFVFMWAFYLVNKISESLEAEFLKRNISESSKPTWNIGIIMCIANTITIVGGVEYLATVAGLASLVSLVAWIVYWGKTREYRIKLNAVSYKRDPDSQIF